MSPVARFVEEMLGRIRREFYSSEKRFYQDRRDLIQAITWPAKWMNRRGVQASASLYREILGEVVETIQAHGKIDQIRRFSIYFLHSVQQHMTIQGDRYYYRAKAVPHVVTILPTVTSRLRPASPDNSSATELLSQVNRIVRSPGGRRRRDSGADSYDLFARCKPSAKPLHNPPNHSQTFADSPAPTSKTLKPRTSECRDS